MYNRYNAKSLGWENKIMFYFVLYPLGEKEKLMIWPLGGKKIISETSDKIFGITDRKKKFTSFWSCDFKKKVPISSMKWHCDYTMGSYAQCLWTFVAF